MFVGKKTEKTERKKRHPNFSFWRIYFLISAIFVCVTLIVLRLFSLQVGAYDFYRQMASDQHKLREKIFPKRGEIYLKEKESLFPAAINKNLATAYAVPAEIEDPVLAAEKIAPILSISQDEISQKLSKKDDLYEVLKRKLSSDEEKSLRDNQIKGIHLAEESWRYYPGNTLAAQTLGFVGYNGDVIEGRYGIESFFEDELKGNFGMLEQERDAGGRWISIGSKSLMPAQNGKDIILTIDHVIQFKTEVALRNAVRRHGADGGKIVIMEPDTGKILAMAAEPSFDLNSYSAVEDINAFRNPLISDTYECGSVFKSITMAAGIDAGKVSPDTTYFDSGQVEEAGFTIKNSDFKSNGTQTMTNVLEKSLNTGAIFVQKQLGNEMFFDYIKNFGFGEKTGIELPHESGGNITNLKTNRNIEFFTASFGQGITVTPLQLANAYSAIANGGQLLQPQIVEIIRNSQKEEKTENIGVIRKVISKNTANQIGLMLESNVLYGHGKLAGVPGYRIAGKTGTAQIPDKERGGYKEGETTGSFAGFGPIDNPIFAMLVIIDNPRDVQWAESTAAPVFGELAKFLMDYFAVEPTEEFSPKDLEKFAKTHNYIDDDPNKEKRQDEDSDESADKKKEEMEEL